MKTVFTYAHVKWFYGQSERAYYLNYFIMLFLLLFYLLLLASVTPNLTQAASQRCVNQPVSNSCRISLFHRQSQHYVSALKIMLSYTLLGRAYQCNRDV